MEMTARVCVRSDVAGVLGVLPVLPQAFSSCPSPLCQPSIPEPGVVWLGLAGPGHTRPLTAFPTPWSALARRQRCADCEGRPLSRV